MQADHRSAAAFGTPRMPLPMLAAALLSSAAAATAAPCAPTPTDADADGIPNTVEDALLERWAPVWIADESQRPPLPLDWVAERAVLRVYDQTTNHDSDPGNLCFEDEGPFDIEALADYPYEESGPCASSPETEYFYRLSMPLIRSGLLLYDPKDGQDPTDPITWDSLNDDERGVYGRVTPLHPRTVETIQDPQQPDSAPQCVHLGEYYRVQYYLFFGDNLADNPDFSVGPCGDFGDHEGDWIYVEFTIRGSEPDSQLVNAIYYNHGRQIFVDSPAGLDYDGDRPIVYLEEEVQEAIPWAGGCGFFEEIHPQSIGTNEVKRGTEDSWVIVGAECGEYSAIREHEGNGPRLDHSTVVNVGESGLADQSRLSHEARFIQNFAGRYGDSAGNEVCICFGCYIFKCFKVCREFGEDDDGISPKGPPYYSKPWNRDFAHAREPEYPGLEPQLFVSEIEVTGTGCERTLTVSLARETPGPRPIQIEIAGNAEIIADSFPELLHPITDNPSGDNPDARWMTVLTVEPGKRSVSVNFTPDLSLAAGDGIAVVSFNLMSPQPAVSDQPTPTVQGDGLVVYTNPQRVNATQSVSQEPMRISWSPVCGAIAYRVERSDPSTGWFSEIPGSPFTGTSAVDSEALTCTTYRYRVTSLFGSGLVSAPGRRASGFIGVPFSSLDLNDEWIQGYRSLAATLNTAIPVPNPGEPVTISTDRPDISLLYSSPGTISDCGGATPTGTGQASINQFISPGSTSTLFAIEFFPVTEPTQVFLSAQGTLCALEREIWLNPIEQWTFADPDQDLSPDATSIPVGTDVRGSAIVDIDLDGFPEIIAGSLDDSKLTVLRNDSGAFSIAQEFNLEHHPELVAEFNLNGDRWPDIVAADSGSSRLYLLTNLGQGELEATPIDTECPCGSLGEMAVADIDADGDDDVVRFVEGEFRIHRNTNGTAQGMLREDFAAHGLQDGHIEDLELQNLVGSPEPDIIVIDSDGAWVLENNGAGTFLPAAQIFSEDDLGVGSPQRLTTDDLDDDGRLDIVVTTAKWIPFEGPEGSVVFALQTDEGWRSQVMSPPFLTLTEDIIASDLDGDGDNDLAILQPEVCGAGGGVVTLLRRTRPLVYSETPGELPVGSWPKELRTGDLDGDGDQEIIVSNLIDQQLSVFWNESATPGPFALGTPIQNAPPASGTDIDANAIVLRWSKSPGASNYTITLATDPEFQNIIHSETLTDASLTLDRFSIPSVTRLWYRVHASSPTGTTPASPPVASFIPQLPPVELFDCNANGIDDLVEINAGSAADANGNQVIDQCEDAFKCQLADISGNGSVGLDDLLAVLGAFGASNPAADTDGSGQVDLNDLLLVLGRFGTNC